MTELSYSHLINKSWPIILASASAPLLGLIDTAIMGHTGDTAQLAGLAVSALVFNFIYWSFGFLRMSTTGFSAQYLGAKKHLQLWLLLYRGLILSIALSMIILLVQYWLKLGAISILSPPAETIDSFVNYFSIRIWSSPATLATYVLSGMLIGMGLSRQLLAIHIFLNLSNALLNILFAVVLDWGIRGIAMGTIIAEYACLLLSLYVVAKALPKSSLGFHSTLKKSINKNEIGSLLSINTDIFIRTLALIMGFAWFTNIGGSFGSDTLAANYILLQFISFSAFFLDGYAHVLESLVGRAIGEKSRKVFYLAVKRSSILACGTATILSISVYLFGHNIIILLTDIPDVIRLASDFLPFAALYILLSCAAFQLDGIFIGATESRAMRNASVLSTLAFIAIWLTLLQAQNNKGLWIAFILFIIIRALVLLFYYPRIKRRCLS